ncbi:MAG TPA: hypothetical protein VE967_06290, partial [Gemmatimonadaceae bacterium]|nr:hypothetical protein [Gemmatimonadaceae bacterium]
MNQRLILAVFACALIADSCGSDSVTSSNGACKPVTISVPGTASDQLKSSGGCTLNGEPSKIFRFTSTGSGLIAFTVTAPFEPSVSVTHDPPTEFVTFSGASPLAGIWQLPSGTYQLRVVSGNGTTGAFTVNSSITATLGCAPRAILPFESVTYSGSLATTDCLLTSDHSYYDVFYIYSTKPCTITMHSVSASVDAYLIVNDAATHARVDEDDNSGG